MYRVIKVLNNNGVLAFDMDKSREVIFLGNGAGFGKKTGELLPMRRSPGETPVPL